MSEKKLTRGKANRMMDKILMTRKVRKCVNEYNVPKYHVKDTGLSIDLIFDDPSVGDISIEYWPEPPYVFNNGE